MHPAHPQASRRMFFAIVLLMIVNGIISYVDRHRAAAEELRRHNELKGLLTEMVGRR